MLPGQAPDGVVSRWMKRSTSVNVIAAVHLTIPISSPKGALPVRPFDRRQLPQPGCLYGKLGATIANSVNPDPRPVDDGLEADQLVAEAQVDAADGAVAVLGQDDFGGVPRIGPARELLFPFHLVVVGVVPVDEQNQGGNRGWKR